MEGGREEGREGGRERGREERREEGRTKGGREFTLFVMEQDNCRSVPISIHDW